MLITRREALAGGMGFLLLPTPADALLGPRKTAALAQVARAVNPAFLFEQNPARKGCVLDFTAAALADGLLFTAATGGAAPLSGQTIALALARRHTAPLGAGLGAELLSNPGSPFTTTTGWTMTLNSLSVVGDYLRSTATSGGADTRLNGIGYVATPKVPHRFVFNVAATGGPGGGAWSLQNRDNVTTASTALSRSTQSAAGSDVSYLAPVNTDCTYRFRWSSASTATTSTYWDIASASVRVIPARAGTQTTSSAMPVWSNANGGTAIFDGVDDVLPIAFPEPFTGEAIILAADGSITQTSGVAVGTTYNFAQSCKMAVLIETLTASERAGVVSYLRSLPIL